MRGARWLDEITNMSMYNKVSRRSYCLYRIERRKQKRKLNTTARGFSAVGTFVFIGIIFVGVLYLFSANDIAVKGDEIYTIENEIKKLSDKNEQLIIEEAQLRSLEDVERVVKDKNMVKIEAPIYLDTDTKIALD